MSSERQRTMVRVLMVGVAFALGFLIGASYKESKILESYDLRPHDRSKPTITKNLPLGEYVE